MTHPEPTERPTELLAFGGTPAARAVFLDRVEAAGGSVCALDLLFPAEGCLALRVPAGALGGLTRELEAAGFRVEDASRPIGALGSTAAKEVP